MSGFARTVYLLGPAAMTRPIVESLRSEAYEAREYENFELFMESLLAVPPWAAVIWDSLGETELRMTFEVLRHHVSARDCAVFLVRSAAAGFDPPPGSIHAVLDAPLAPAAVFRALRQCSDAGVQPGSGIPQILVVDDDQNIVLLGSHIVSSMGMIPLPAFDGAEAVDKAVHFRPDLVLLDINMPGMDGFAVIEALKADPVTSLIPIIVFSARRKDEDKVKALQLGADDYVTKPFSITELSARIDRLLKRTRMGVSASSTTGLPGSLSVEQVLVERIRKGVPLAVLYLDVDYFKTFNDRYGFARGDSVIRQTADIILTAVQELGNSHDFVGHIGGDDFVVVSTPDLAEAIAVAIVARFDALVPYYYEREDRERGQIVSEDRKGKRTSFPLMSLSVAIVTNETRAFHHAGEVADVAAQLKRYAKSQPGNLWVKDQRANNDAKA